MSTKPRLWAVCGRIVGTAMDWDQGDTFVMQLYDFVPANNWIGPKPIGGIISFDFELGKVETWDANGQVVDSFDLITVLSACTPGEMEKDPSDPDYEGE